MPMPTITLDARDAEYIKNSTADTSCKPRILIERVIVRKAVEALLAAGFYVSVDASGENGFDKEALEIFNSRDLDAIMAACMVSDDEILFVSREPTTEDDSFDSYVKLVYGNDGWDVISDYQTDLEDVLKPVNVFADTLAEGALFIIANPLAEQFRDWLRTGAPACIGLGEEGQKNFALGWGAAMDLLYQKWLDATTPAQPAEREQADEVEESDRIQMAEQARGA